MSSNASVLEVTARLKLKLESKFVNNDYVPLELSPRCSETGINTKVLEGPNNCTSMTPLSLQACKSELLMSREFGPYGLAPCQLFNGQGICNSFVQN